HFTRACTDSTSSVLCASRRLQFDLLCTVFFPASTVIIFQPASPGIVQPRSTGGHSLSASYEPASRTQLGRLGENPLAARGSTRRIKVSLSIWLPLATQLYLRFPC